MRRQLRATGGITNARQGYGIGSWVKERVRKIIPNELADIATKAAPFVAPFYPGAAAAMRGIGRFDKRGSISDAMKQAALTYAGGKGARYLGGVDPSLMPGQDDITVSIRAVLVQTGEVMLNTTVSKTILSAATVHEVLSKNFLSPRS